MESTYARAKAACCFEPLEARLLLSNNFGSSLDVGHDVSSGEAECIYDFTTGELFFDVGADVMVIGIGSSTQPPGWIATGSVGAFFTHGPVQNDGDTLAYFSVPSLTEGENSVGICLPIGLTASDIYFSYTPAGGDTTEGLVTLVPEPATALTDSPEAALPAEEPAPAAETEAPASALPAEEPAPAAETEASEAALPAEEPAPAAETEAPEAASIDIELPDKPADDVVSPRLRHAHAVLESGGDVGSLGIVLRANDAGELQVYVHVEAVDASIIRALEGAGLRVETSNARMSVVQGWLPHTHLDLAAAVEGVRRIAPPEYAITKSGSVTDLADSAGDVDVAGSTMDLMWLPGAAGGDAVFYVDSLRGFGADEEPNGTVDSWDINGFTQKYLARDLDADFHGFGAAEDPNGVVDSWDINGFTSRFSTALATNAHLGNLPTLIGGGMAVGATSPLPPLAAEPAALTDSPEAALLAEEPAHAAETEAPAALPGETAPAATAADDDFTAGALVASVAAAAPQSPAWSPAASETAASPKVADSFGESATDIDLAATGSLLDPLDLPALNVRL